MTRLQDEVVQLKATLTATAERNKKDQTALINRHRKDMEDMRSQLNTEISKLTIERSASATQPFPEKSKRRSEHIDLI
jgi:hypothetical protein